MEFYLDVDENFLKSGSFPYTKRSVSGALSMCTCGMQDLPEENKMTDIHGFKLLKRQDIKELKTDARLYIHTKTGAELLSLSNDDENKVFGITFRTPPPIPKG